MFSAQIDKGLELRLLEPRHAEALFNLIDQNREHLSAWFPSTEKTKTIGNAKTDIREALEQFSKGDGFQLGIWLDRKLVGAIGARDISSVFRSTEIGYWLGKDHQGRGVMTKACRYLCAYLFEELRLNRIEIRCSEANLRSRAIPERLGFTLEGKLRQMGYTKDGLTNYLVYGLLKDEWQKE